MQTHLFRILDANFNRSREGLRVCEDICRFVIAKPSGASQLRSIRHRITSQLKSLSNKDLLTARDAAGDSGRKFNALEKKRAGWQDIYLANLERSKESLRVLEEVMKLEHPKKAATFKKLRFDLYNHEKNFALKF